MAVWLTAVSLFAAFANEGEEVSIYLPFVQKPPAIPTITITKIFFDGLEFYLEGDEYVEIRNDDNVPVQLLDWTLHDLYDNHVFTFPSYVMQPGQICRIYTDEVHAQWCGFSFMKDYGAIWNNDVGDEATLRDSSGQVVDVCAYVEGEGTTAVCE